MPVGVPVGIGAAVVAKKDAEGTLFKVPAIPLGRQSQQQNAVASSSSLQSNNKSPPNTCPVAGSLSHYPSKISPLSRTTPPTVILNSPSTSALASPTSNTSSLSSSAAQDLPSPTELAEHRRTFLASLSFLFPWLSSASAEAAPVRAVDWACGSWGVRSVAFLPVLYSLDVTDFESSASGTSRRRRD